MVLLGLSSVINAAYLDDWPDDALCGWMQQTSPPEYMVKEVKKRGILCKDGLASIDPNASQAGSSSKQRMPLFFTSLTMYSGGEDCCIQPHNASSGKSSRYAALTTALMHNNATKKNRFFRCFI